MKLNSPVIAIYILLALIPVSYCMYLDAEMKNKIQDYELSKKTLNLLSNLNFLIDVHPCGGMVSNLGSVIDSAKSEWILYCEDDVILKNFPEASLLRYSPT